MPVPNGIKLERRREDGTECRTYVYGLDDATAADDREAMILKWVPWAIRLANDHFVSHRFPADERVAVALHALVRAADKFDPELGYQFSTYAGRVIWSDLNKESAIRGSILRLPFSETKARALAAEFQEIHIDARTGISEAAIAEQYDYSYQEEFESDADSLRAIGEDLLSHVDERAANILRWRSQGQTLDVIGDRLGITRERVRQVESRAIGKIRDVIARGEKDYGLLIETLGGC